MQPAEDFLHDYFRDRTEMHRSSGLLYESIAARFFAPTYIFFDPKKSVADSEAERILSVQTSGATVEIMTCGWFGGLGDCRFRYRLSATADSWQIACVELECPICHGSEKWNNQPVSCRCCKGKGWCSMAQTLDA